MIEINLNWFEFKQIINNNVQFQYVLDSKSNYKIFALNGTILFICNIPKDDVNNRNSDQIDFEDNYSSLAITNLSSEVAITEQTPFAKPDYRTKRDAIENWITCPANTPTILDFQLTEERYVTGGEIIFKNSKEGDYITAEVYDKDSVIPAEHRVALCENHPTVAKYVLKKWIIPTEVDKYGSFMIDTYPLNAKISAGLYLRVTYNTSSETGDRKCAINYHLTQKL